MPRKSGRIRIGVAACGVCCLALSAPAAAAERLVVRAGETFEAAMARQAADQNAASLRASWLAAGHAAISTAPQILSGTVLSPSIQIGDPASQVAVQVKFKGGAGLAAVFFTLTAPNGLQSFNFQYTSPPPSASGSVSFAAPNLLALTSLPGTWTLTSATIQDIAGNQTVYDAAQLAALFTASSTTVVNTGFSDGTPPAILGGKLLTPTVHISATAPQFEAVIRASDTGSGVAQAYVFIQPPGVTYYYAYLVPLPLPHNTVNAPAYGFFSSGDATGVWTMVGYAACDAASNCNSTTSSSAVQALFGTTTFTVTQ